MSHQKSIFLSSEADQYFERNKALGDRNALHPHHSFVREFLPQPCRFLEIGCGDGLNVYSFTHKLSTEYHGLDPSTKAVQAAKKRCPEQNFTVGTADQLPFEDQSFDCIYLGFFLYLVDRELLTKIVSEVDRCLKNNGILAITDFSPISPHTAPYKHHSEVLTYKYCYENMFTGFPHFQLIEKRIHQDGELSANDDSWIATSVLLKNYQLHTSSRIGHQKP